MVDSVSSTVQGQANIVTVIQSQQKGGKMCSLDSLMAVNWGQSDSRFREDCGDNSLDHGFPCPSPEQRGGESCRNVDVLKRSLQESREASLALLPLLWP